MWSYFAAMSRMMFPKYDHINIADLRKLENKDIIS